MKQGKKALSVVFATVLILVTVVIAAGSASAVTYTLDSPTIESLENVTDGVMIRWKAVDGAENYAVYSRTGNGSWASKGKTQNNYFVDTAVNGGKTYEYKVRCVSDSGIFLSPNTEQTPSVTYIAAPSVTSLSNALDGITVKFTLRTGATDYLIYRRDASQAERFVGVAESSSFTDTTVRSGVAYSYAVKAVSASNAAGSALSAYSDGKKFLSAPTVTNRVNKAAGVSIGWDAVPGAEYYCVLRKTETGSWTRKAVTTDTSYLDTAVTGGKRYQYKVRCSTSSGNTYLSANPTDYSDGTFLTTPKVSSLTNTDEGVQVKWNKVSAADEYVIYRRLSTKTTWVQKATLSAEQNTWLDTNTFNGSTYIYSVRAVSNTGNQSSRYTGGLSIMFLKSPEIKTISNLSTGVKMTWNSVKGAQAHVSSMTTAPVPARTAILRRAFPALSRRWSLSMAITVLSA